MVKLLLRRYGPFSGHGLPVAGVSRQLGFYEVRVSAPRHTPNLVARIYLFKIRCTREGEVHTTIPMYEFT
jgi:hypothetical protein